MSAPRAASWASAARWPPPCPHCTGPSSSRPSPPCCPAGRPAPITSKAASPAGRPPQLHRADYDEVIAIPEAQAFATARHAARDEGIFSGPSTGANLAAALGIARRLGPGHRVVTLQVDSGLKYLTGPLYR